MPIHLAPLSRRQFLGRTVAAGAGLALCPHLSAAEKPVDENFWALFSDLHLAADRTFLFRNSNMAEHFQTVSKEVLGLPERPAAVLVDGDCAYSSGEKGDYTVLAELLRPLREGQLPVYLALGNHDHRERFWEGFPEEKAAKRPVMDRQTALIRTARANWFILDSLETTLSTPGLLGKEQMTWLSQALDANPDKAAIVVIHHNPGLSGNMGLKDTLLLYEVIRPRKQVKAYIFGHTHTWKIDQDASGIHLINLPAVSYAFADGQPTGWVKAHLKEEGMRLELRCTDPSHKSHGEVVNLEWRKAV
jgi:3',5'-cyclic-AMP phosphodiesterase